MGSAAVSAEHSNSTPRADTLEDATSTLTAHCTLAYRFKGGVPALGESPAPLVRVRAHIELERSQTRVKASTAVESLYRGRVPLECLQALPHSTTLYFTSRCDR